GLVRAGLLSASPTAVPLRFTFQDVVVLRKVKALLAAGVSPRRVRGELGDLVRREPGAALARMTLVADGGHVAVREDGATFRVDTGQGLLPLALAEPAPAGVVADMPVR